MSFASALNVLRPTLPYYLALTKYGLLRITKDCFEFHPDPAAPPIALEMASAVFTDGRKLLHRVLRHEPHAGRRAEGVRLRRPDLRGPGELRPERVHCRLLAALPVRGDRAARRLHQEAGRAVRGRQATRPIS